MNQRSPNAPPPERAGLRPPVRPAAGLAPEPPARTLRALEAELAIYRAALEDTRQELQDFAAAVSHDLRAPLRAIEGFSKILLEDFAGGMSEEPRRLLTQIIASSRVLGSQLEDLRRFHSAGCHALQIVRVNSGTLCEEAIAGLGKEAGPHAQIVLHDLPEVPADPARLREIFAELAGNALKATRNTPGARIEVDGKTEPGAVTFHVRDNGIGFEPDHAGRLFQVFQKLHASTDFPGNGIGLAIVRRLVEAHGGCVSAAAGPGRGAVFSFSIPVRPEPGAVS